METSTMPKVDVDVLLCHWVHEGLITAEQAALMRADVPLATPTAAVWPAPRATSLVIEALGYLGGVLIMVALGLVVGQYWADLSIGGQLALTGAVTVLLLFAGAAVPHRRGGGVGSRLRAVLWMAAAVGLAAFLGLAGADVFGWEESAVATFAAGGAAVLATTLWYLHRQPVLHVAVLAATVATAIAATTLLPDAGFLPGVAMWGVGVVWAVLSWGGLYPPRRLGVLLGSVVTTFGALFVASEGWGSALAVTTVVALVAFALLVRDLVLLTVAALGTLNVLPVVVSRFFPGVLSAAMALLTVGLFLVGAAVVTARRKRSGPAHTNRRDWSSGPRPAALTAAAVVAVAVIAVVLALGL
jgi:hypothetical protein